MIKKHKIRIIISSIIILIPILFGLIMWNDLPDIMTTHFGIDGKADGFGGKAFTVFVVPCIFLVAHFICLLFTLLDKRQKDQTPKALGMVFWIMPVLSLSVCGILYRTAFDKEIDLTVFIPLLLGIIFIFMGNYLPKVKQNRTLGIKIWWTCANEENWNKTHRFAGKVWVVGGIIILFSIFLKLMTMIWVMMFVIIAIAVIPISYSYYIYKQHKKQGIEYVSMTKSKAEKISAKISIIAVPIILIVVAIFMFTGDIEVNFEASSFEIKASYWTDSDMNYSEIDTLTYRKDLDVGVRTNGIGSARLSIGIFQNEEFGSYTLYAYAGAEEYIVLTAGEKTLVIGMRDIKDTQTIYNTLLEKTGK